MESFIIEGGHPLSGTITPQGAKNEALEVICATLLTEEKVVTRNVPDILDVNNLILLLKDIGVSVERIGKNEYTFESKDINLDYLGSEEFVKKCSSLRGSVLMIGPLLARFGKAVVAKPGHPLPGIQEPGSQVRSQRGQQHLRDKGKQTQGYLYAS